MARENDFLSDEQVNFLKEKLLQEKQRILNKENDHRNFCLDTNELSDPLDEASANIQTSQELRFRNRENFFLKKINQGLQRIEVGTYGLCDNCDGRISFERLKARTTAELCIVCKEESESLENNNFWHKKSKSLGKTLAEMGRRAR